MTCHIDVLKILPTAFFFTLVLLDLVVGTTACPFNPLLSGTAALPLLSTAIAASMEETECSRSTNMNEKKHGRWGEKEARSRLFVVKKLLSRRWSIADS
jgi:hypothetical protein